jgi:site-specific DNA recombinase
MKCVAYMRVSTEKQAEEGNGLESQKRDIENYCRKNELIIADWYVDEGYTGSNMNRPELQRLITDCSRKKVNCVVAFQQGCY